MSTTSRRSLRQLMRNAAGVAVAMAVMNVSTYAFTILAAHLLGPRAYGSVASLMGLLLVLTVLSLGFQATGARRVAAEPERRDEIERSLLTATYSSALALGLLCAAMTPVIRWALDLDSWVAALMLAVSVVPITAIGGQLGILQGEERWRPLGVVYLAVGLGRLVAGALIMPAVPSTFGAMLAVALGAWIPAIVGAIALGHTGRRGAVPLRIASPMADAARRILREVVGNSNALLAFFALTNVDIVMARIRFSEHEAGLYAGGLILTKAVLFLPQFVVVIAFPSMAAASTRHRRMYLRALAVVGAIGIAATVGAAALSDLAIAFIGGGAYRAVEPNIWLFATLGTLLALVQMMIYELVARQHQVSVLVVWCGLLAVGVVGVSVDSGPDLVRAVTIVDAAVLGALLVLARFHPALRPGAHEEPITRDRA